ncbi:hypothetical protein PIB30_044378 [Stylosanthes scabra]|uniref:RRM domain-containing protein n=1 Tax=Stylosanthes scabra TaxID=79078 RepID=A0ABU6VFD3_9FABA|nr:hypothetical protein [Stylosanthes scabra]
MRVGIGERRGVRDESGKHGEVSGYVGRRNKGESVGGFVSGVRRFNHWGWETHKQVLDNRRDEPHTVFEDNLPMDISKRKLYKEFGRCGFITDVFVSRKMRQTKTCPFAFIRFNMCGGAEKAIGMLNGKLWDMDNLLVSKSKYGRNGTAKTGRQARVLPVKETQRRVQKWVIKNPRITQKWVEVRKRSEEAVKVIPKQKIKEVNKEVIKKVVDAVWAEDQKERLQRSLTGVCVQPIELREVMDRLLDEWRGPGEIEVRDIGPYRCLITFSSTEIRDGAFNDELLLSKFDELRPHWDIFECLSRRVWIEVTGMPVCIWCHENFERIAKLWGKPIRYDDRADESKSFTTVRILIDCFEWEKIQGWISLKVDDRDFEVFVKEFGPEIYSIQSHPDLVDVYSGDDEDTMNISPAVQSPVDNGRIQAMTGGENLKLFNGNDPRGEGLNGCTDMIVDDGRECSETRREETDHDPMILEAHLIIGNNSSNTRLMGSHYGPHSAQPNNTYGSAHSDSCPYPLGFEPVGNVIHGPREFARASVSESVVRETPVENGKNERGFTVEGDDIVYTESISESSDTRYLINRARFEKVVEQGVVVDAAVAVHGAEACGGVADAALNEQIDDELSEETLYRINPGIPFTDFGVTGLDGVGAEADFEGGSADTIINSCGNVNELEVQQQQDDDEAAEISEAELEDEVNGLKFSDSKNVWQRVGFFLDSSDEEEITARLVDGRNGGKKRAELKPKKQRQNRKPSCIQGKTWATRKLRSVSKPKQK